MVGWFFCPIGSVAKTRIACGLYQNICIPLQPQSIQTSGKGRFE